MELPGASRTCKGELSLASPGPILQAMEYGKTSPRLAAALARLPPERVARAEALQGKPVNWFEPKAVIACVLGQVNAPCRRP